MKSTRIFYMMKKEFIQMLRDRRVIFLILIPPLIQLIMFGYIATTDVRHISLAILDEDHSVLSRRLIEEFRGSKNFDIKFTVTSKGAVRDLLDGGRVVVAIDIGCGFEKKVLRGEGAPVQVILDGADSNFATIAGGYASSIISSFSSDRLKERFMKRGIREMIAPLENKPRIWFNEELKSVNYMVPGIVGMLMAISTMMLSALGIVKEKEHGTLEQLMVTPLRPGELLIGKMAPYVVTSLVQMLLIVTFGVFWFRVPFRGDFFLLLSLVPLFLLPSLGLGLFISLISGSQYQAFMTGFLVLQPTIMLSGFIFPIKNMPPAIQVITYFLPVRYFLEIIRGIFLKGVGIEYLWPQIWPLLILGVVIFTASVVRFRKKLT